jgi:hypothetical protein
MDFVQFRKEIERTQSNRWTPRQKLLDAFERALWGELYAHKNAPYTQEFFGGLETGRRLRLDERRAAVEVRLPWMLVREIVGETWGEEHRPNILVHDDDYTATWVAAFLAESSLWLTMIEASIEASVGSAAVVMRVLGDDSGSPGRYYFEVWPAKECIPLFVRHQPDKLRELSRTYFVAADTLRSEGYDVDALEEEWENKRFGRTAAGRRRSVAQKNATTDEWVIRVVLDANAEMWYQPVPRWYYEQEDWTDAEWILDEDRTFTHGLGEVPAVWLRPLPFRHKMFPDGLCLFEPAINFQFRIDRTLSQTGRAFDYAGDPQLAVTRGTEGAGSFGDDDELEEVGATASDMIELGPEGKAEFVEISGDGLRVAIESYVKMLMQLAREVAGMSMIDNESKPGVTTSGVALKLLRNAIRTIVGVLRITLGEQGLLPLVRMAMRVAQRVNVDLPSLAARLQRNEATGTLDPEAFMELQWPNAYQPEGQDKLYEVQALKAAVSAINGPPLISMETGIANAAPLFDVQDSAKELDAVLRDASLLAKLQPERDAQGDNK